MALFPRLADCSHFHYENVSLHPFTATLSDIEASGLLVIMVVTVDNGWRVRRTWSQLVAMDTRFHDCIISRATTGLPALGERFDVRRSVCSISGFFDDVDESRPVSRMSQSRLLDDDARMVDEHRTELICLLNDYFSTFSTYTNNPINCAPILNFFEMDNHGYRLKVPDEETVNKPAVAAARVVRRHVAQDSDEISLEVGDLVSIVDMPEGAPWWRAKQGMRVGFFPAECVSLIGRFSAGAAAAGDEAPPDSSDPSGYKPVTLSRGKTISRLILALFGKSRPTKLQLRRSGILRDRVFGSDLGVYLSASRREVPLPLMVCAQIIEDNGVVDGIYRRSGAQTHVQALRRSFDEDRRPQFDPDLVTTDIHCFSSLLKIYFGELPTPLFSHTIYGMLRSTLDIHGEEDRLNSTFRVLSRLPPPYFRTARYLFVHLKRMADDSAHTYMTAKNLAICWAPNLMKPFRELDYNRPDPSIMAEARDNPRLVEYIISYAPQLFSDRPPDWEDVVAAKNNRLGRANFPSLNGLDADQPNLISLAEARRKFGCQSVCNMSTDEDVPAVEPGTKQRAHSMVDGGSRRDARDADEAPLISAPRMVPSSPVLSDTSYGSSPTSASRQRFGNVLPALQQKQQLIQRQQQRQQLQQQQQRQSDSRLLSGSGSTSVPPSAFRNRSHSLIESGGPASPDLMAEMREEQARRRRKLKPSFSGVRRPNRTHSALVNTRSFSPICPDVHPPRRVGASVFYVPNPTINAPAAAAAVVSSQPVPRRRAVPHLRSCSVEEPRPSAPARPQPAAPERTSWRSSSPVATLIPRPIKAFRPFSSSSSSSYSSSSSSSASLTPPGGASDDGDGEVTPKGSQSPAHSPVMVVARATPAVAPRRGQSSARASWESAPPPEYENLQHFRRISGLSAAPSQSTHELDSSQRRAEFSTAEDKKPDDRPPLPPARRPRPPRPLPPHHRLSQRDASPKNSSASSTSPSPALSSAPFQRSAPVRQSLPTRMDRVLTGFPNDMRCYLPETNV